MFLNNQPSRSGIILVKRMLIPCYGQDNKFHNPEDPTMLIGSGTSVWMICFFQTMWGEICIVAFECVVDRYWKANGDLYIRGF
jgi:hypothetical protein